MKECKSCNEYTCGAQGTDNISNVCNMKSFDTGAVREDKSGKGRMDLLPMCALIRLSKHYEAGTAAHGERNWEKGIPMHSFLDSALRHLAKYMDGQTDEDHLCAAAWNILGAMWTEEKKPEMQDIPSRTKEKILPSASDNMDGTTILSSKETQENTKETPPKTCKYYRDMGGSPRCSGSKGFQSCNCNGDENKCENPHHKHA